MSLAEKAMALEPAHNMPLKQLAMHINGLLGQAFDVRRDLAVALAEARDRVPRETGENFYLWAARELRRPDGSPWKYSVLAKYVSWGKDPTKLEKSRRQIAAKGRFDRAVSTIVCMKTRSVDDEVRALVALWSNASPEARRIFMQQIGLKHMGAK